MKDEGPYCMIITGIEATTYDTWDFMDIDYYDCREDAFDYAAFLIEVTHTVVEDFTQQVAKEHGLNYYIELKHANRRYERR